MLIRHRRRAPQHEDPLTLVRRKRGPTPEVLGGLGSGLGGREAYDAFGLLEVDEYDLQPGALARTREQVLHAAAGADEWAR
jgi:hypothetical protein